jgi:hypothetical protein
VAKTMRDAQRMYEKVKYGPDGRPSGNDLEF